VRRLQARADAEAAKPPTPAVLLNTVPIVAPAAHVTCGAGPQQIIWRPLP